MDLPAPRALEIHDMAAAAKWRAFKFAWESYALAKGIATKDEKNSSRHFVDGYR